MTDRGRGAIPKTTVSKKSTIKGAVVQSREQAQFARSDKTVRTPPKNQEAVGRADESVYLCQICHVEDNVEKIHCDKCTLWYHFDCAALNKDVLQQDEWICSNCLEKQQRTPTREGILLQIDSVNPLGDSSSLPPPKEQIGQNPPNVGHQMTDTKRSGSVTSTMSRRAALALQRLEEERVLSEKREREALEKQRERDREYLDQKYSILEDDVASNLSFEDEEVNEHKLESVRQWATNGQLLRPQSNSTIADQRRGLEANTDASDKRVCDVIANVESNNSRVKLPTWLTNPSIPEPVRTLPWMTTTTTDEEYHASTQLGQVNYQLSTMGNCATSSAATSTLGWLTTQPMTHGQQQTTKPQLLQSGSVGHQINQATIAGRPINSYAPVGATVLQTSMSNDQIIDQIIGRNHQVISTPTQPVNVNNPQYLGNSQSKFGASSQPQIVLSSHSQVGQPYRTSQTSVNNWTSQAFGFEPSSGTAQTSNTSQPYSQAQSFGFGSLSNTAQTFNTNQPYSQFRSFGSGLTSGMQTFNTSQPNHQSQSMENSNYNQPHDVVNVNGADNAQTKLTAEQIAARHVMSTLPAFYGDSLEWLSFISSYENSTKTCGYTNSENLGRLQKSLKGDAKTAVQSRLIHKDSVPGVIETLRLLFGRPEQILEKMIGEVQTIPAPTSDDLPALIKFAIAVQNLSSTIQNVGGFEHLHNPTLMNAITDKLPTQHCLSWAFYKQTIGNVHVGHLGDWLYQIADVASRVVRVSTGSNKQAKRHKSEEGKKSNNRKSDRDSNPDMSGYVNAQMESTNKRTNSRSESMSKGTRKCPICNESSCQRVKECKKFNKLTQKERWALVKEKELCFRCFGYHQIKKCKSKQKCNVGDCQKAHNPLLHEDEKSAAATNSKTSDVNKIGTTNVNCSHLTINRHIDIFRIVPVKLIHNGKSVKTFAYLDDGSNVTTMENDLADELNLESSGQENLCVKWSFGKIRREELVSRRVSVHISGVQENADVYELHNVRTVNDLALPSQTITQEWLDSYAHFKGIPVTPYENAKPRMLIGLQYSKLMVSHKSVEGNWMEPIACKTRLGWIIQGPEGGDDRGDKKNSTAREKFSMNICECERDDSNLHAMIQEFLSWENFGVKITDQILESRDMQRARKILESTTKKIQGRYETGLLWRYDDVRFPETYPMALKRLECLERKMEKDPNLSKKMCEYIQDFVNKGYIRKLTPSELQKDPSRVCYLPIFPVFNPKKPEKFRVVWDVAAMVKKTSLNSMLLAGPDLLVPLPNVLRRFREKPIGITGDMKEMFHQVRVIESDIHAQRFLWRDGKTKRQPEIFVVEVLTFGGKNSPSSAQYVKNRNALEFKNKFPRAVEAITENHYQDDMLESCDDVEEAVRLTEEVKTIHRHGGFELRNFKSNSQEVLKKLGEKSDDNMKNLDISMEPVTERVLGMYWKTSTDTFTYSLKYTKIPDDVWSRFRRPSKREVLSAVMSIFDPLGLIAHFMVRGKILLQKIWREGTDWDEKLSDESYEYWLKWIEDLPKIEKLEIPRWYSSKLVATNQKRIQLHMFADAGGEACAAAVYYRIEDEMGVDCCLIGAKTKVTPNKPMSMPRLELQAAVLGLRLVNNISQCQTIKYTERFFWSDSQTVLGWINSEARKFHQFVAFRVGEILDSSTPTEWNYVNTSDNVADDATKWRHKLDLSSTSRWYKAPSFLYQQQDTWMAGNKKVKFSTDEEMRAVYLLAYIDMPNHNIIDANRFSDWNRLKRVVAYALRFVDNAKLRKKDRRIGPLHRDEFIRARNTLMKQAQREEFLEEILTIRKNESLSVDKRKELHKSSALRTCSPYLDEEGVLRIRGRVDAADSLAFKTKRPLILPRHNHITKLIVYAYHRKFHHLNHKTTLNEINQTYFVQALRVVLKSVIHNMCQRCKNDKAKPAIPEMAELPPARLSTFSRPFTYVGVDYFGPIKVKVRRHPEKRWGVIFTCLTTRAVFIEVAHSLETSSCIFCIRNFINRSGQPLEFFSDNGTNFHGSERELREEFAKLNKVKIESAFTDENTQWSFNPPTAAHMGGAWERLIRSVKSVLKKSLPTRLPTDEMLRSYLIEIENIINSRPLTYIELDHVDDDVLTPNHFLKGSSNGLKSPGQFDPKNLLRDDWKAVQEMTNGFWKKFVLEYLPTLTRRTKWFKDVKPIEVGDVVIVIDEQGDRNDWRKGIVEEVAMGKVKVRRAKVRMILGEKANLMDKDIKKIKHQLPWRPVSKLAILNVNNNKLNRSPEPVNGEGNVGNAPQN